MKDFIVNDEETLEQLLAQVREAQRQFATFTQEQVDKIFFEAAMAANKMRIPLAKMAVEETGMGIVEDKVIKNHYASEYIYNAYRNTKTCGVIERDPAFGIMKVAEPIGVLAAVVPTTNPTSTAIFKSLIALKTRNGIIFSPHPRAKKCTIEAAKIVLEAAVKAGAPEISSAGLTSPPLHSPVSSCVRQTALWQPAVPVWSERHIRVANPQSASAQATRPLSSTARQTLNLRLHLYFFQRRLTTV